MATLGVATLATAAMRIHSTTVGKRIPRRWAKARAWSRSMPEAGHERVPSVHPSP